MAAKRKRRRYAGALASPIVPPPPPAFWGAVTPNKLAAYQKKMARFERAAVVALERELFNKLFLLFKHYHIKDKNDFAALAWALAYEHVPGFKVLEPRRTEHRGRKRKWDGDRYEQLLETVQSIREQHKSASFGDRRALAFMVKDEGYGATWGPPPNHRGTKQQWIETLESRLQDAKSIRGLRRIEWVILGL